MFTEAYAADAPWNETMWKNPRFNVLLKAARAELDENKARDMYWEMQQIVRDDGGAVIPMFADHLIAYSDKLAHGTIAGNWDLDGNHVLERVVVRVRPNSVAGPVVLELRPLGVRAPGGLISYFQPIF